MQVNSLVKPLIAFIIVSIFAIDWAFAEQPVPCTTEIKMTNAIGPASLDQLQRALEVTRKNSCQSLLVLINTPGGSLQSTRLIVEEILNSPVPILCLVHPSGGHAGSAGAIILQACHVSGAMVATNIGAATPISGLGKEIPEDLRKKLLNDTRSWLEGITKHRERSEKFGQDIILEAKAVDAKKALELGAIEWAGDTKEEFLQFANGRKVKLSGKATTEVQVGDVQYLEPDLKHKVLELIADPQIAYMMFMGSLALLYYEITHPGMMVPGVLGGIGLVLALISLHKLEVVWGGVLLIVLGIGFMLAEAFVPSFGILGVGGIISFVVGSILMFDVATTGYSLPYSLILPSALLLGGITLGLGYMAVSSLRIKARGEFQDILGREGKVVKVKNSGKTGLILVEGENWKFKSEKALQMDDVVEVKDHKGLTLLVQKKEV
jgi:membrane-bound serine protease (ClpP class)